MDRGLRRQLGVEPQVSVKDRVAWFYWDKPEMLDTIAVSDAVLGGSLAIFEFHVILRVDFEGGKARLERLGIELAVEPAGQADGVYAVELTGFADESTPLTIWSIGDAFEPKVYQDVLPDSK